VTWLQFIDSSLVLDNGQAINSSDLTGHLKKLLQDAGHLRKLSLHGTMWFHVLGPVLTEFVPSLQELEVSEVVRRRLAGYSATSLLTHAGMLTSLTTLKLGPTLAVDATAVMGLLSALDRLHTLHIPCFRVSSADVVNALLNAPALTDLMVSVSVSAEGVGDAHQYLAACRPQRACQRQA
jgi:hypothetical protein